MELLKYILDKPKEEGYYFVRQQNTPYVWVCQVFLGKDRKTLYIDHAGNDYVLAEFGGKCTYEFAGPIPEPTN